MRKFIASHAAKVKAPNEAEALKIRKLTLQCEREQHELDTAREKTRNELRDDLMEGFVAVAQMIRSGLFRMRNELAPVFAAGMDGRGIYRAWENRERQLFAAVCAELAKKSGAPIDEHDTRATANVVVPFKPSKNGNGQTNGAKAINAAGGRS
jgi:hypothetical protein